MSFNPDPSKQAQEVILNRKLKKVVFNNANVSLCKSEKHLGMVLDSKFIPEEQYKTILCKTNRSIRVLRKLQNLLPREALMTIYKAFVRSHLDHGDVFFDQAFNISPDDKL